MTMNRFTRRFLTVLNHTLNPLTRSAARRGLGPFWLIQHTGRKSGGLFEAPLILAEAPGGFVAELTYGDRVNWYRNIMAATRTGVGAGVIVRGDHRYLITAVEDLDTETGLHAFGGGKAVILRMLRRHEFRLLKAEEIDSTVAERLPAQRC